LIEERSIERTANIDDMGVSEAEKFFNGMVEILPGQK
jgi:hypothetical protein